VPVLLLAHMLCMRIFDTQNAKVFCWAALAGFAAVLLKTESQSAQVAAIAGFAFLFLFPVRRKPAWHILSAVFVLLVFASPWIVQWMYDDIAPLMHRKIWFKQGYAAAR